MTAPTQRPYQLAAGAATEKAFLDNRLNRLLVKKPTGTGKTVWFAGLLSKFPRLKAWRESLPAKGAQMLVIAHREELLEQAREKIEKQNPGLMVSIEQAEKRANTYSDVIVASIQTLASSNYKRVKSITVKHPNLRIVIVDEAHHAAARSYRTVLAHLGFLPFAVDLDDRGELAVPNYDDADAMKQHLAAWDRLAPKDRLLIGVTATPNRSDAIGLECVFQTIAYSYSLKQAIADGWLVPPKPWVIESDVNLDEVRTTHGDFNQKDLAKAVDTERRNQMALAGWQEHAYGIPTIGFTVDVEHAHHMTERFLQAGIAAAAISGETPREQRRQILRDYTAGKVTVIFNCMVLTEGTDLPLTGCILHLKPTKSATLYEQMTGRGLRLFEGKRECLVLDVVDVARRHSLQTAPVLYGLPPGLKTDGEDLQAIAEALEALREKFMGIDLEALLASGRLTLAELQAKASTFDIWTIPDLGAVAASVSMNWMRTGTDTYRLQYPWADGVEVLQVEKDLLGHYDISVSLRPSGNRETAAAPIRQRTLASQVPTVEAALALGETFVRQERNSASRMADPTAAWRQLPASAGQLGLLRSLGVQVRRKLKKGEASDMINFAKARKGR